MRKQAEIHRVIYTPLGQKYHLGDPDLSRGYRSPRNQGSPPCVSKEQAEQPLCTLHQTASEDGRQEVSSPPQMRGLEGQTVACFFSAGSVSFILYSVKPQGHVCLVQLIRHPRCPRTQGIVSVMFLKTRSMSCAV